MRAQVFEVEWAGGNVEEVTVDGRDWLHLEEVTGESCLPLLTEQARHLGAWYKSAWAGLHRQGRFDGGLDEFAERARFVLPVSGDPTPPADTPPAE